MKLNHTGTVLLKVENNDIQEDGSFTIPRQITRVCNWAFSECSNLQTISLPPGITEIADYAFSCCSSLHSIIIDGSNEEYKRIKALLPFELRNQVISRELAAQAYQALDKQLTRIINTEKFNPLYRYLSTNVSEHKTVRGNLKNDPPQNIRVEYPLIPDELLQHMNGFITHALPAHQHAKQLMHKQPLPKSEDQLLTYQKTLERIVNATVAMFTQEYKSDFEKHLWFLKKKAAFFVRNDQPAAARAIETLYQQLMNSYLNTLPQNSVQFQNECRQAIYAARNELEQHQGWNLILNYLLPSATGLGVLVVLADVGYHYATGKHFSFFQTTTNKQLNALEDVVSNDFAFPALKAE